MMIKYKELAQIALNVTLVSTMIGVLFFTVIKDAEQDIVRAQTGYVAESLASDVKLFFPPQVRASIVAKLAVPDMRDADATVAASNAKLKATATKVLGALCAAGVALTLGLCRVGQVGIVHVLLEALVILAFAAATELLFINMVAKTHVSADPNDVKLLIVKAVKAEFSVPRP